MRDTERAFLFSMTITTKKIEEAQMNESIEDLQIFGKTE